MNEQKFLRTPQAEEIFEAFGFTRCPRKNSAKLVSYYHGRVALIGDAAHAMLPFQRSGAEEGIEDTYLLAAVLGHASTTLETIPRSLSVYDKIRRPYIASALRARIECTETECGGGEGHPPDEAQ